MNSTSMRPAFVVEIVTPKKYILNGLWFGPKKPKRVIVWVHGLGSTMFGKLGIADHLADNETAVLVFNNRGSGTVARVGRVKGKSIQGGSAHEVFTDCVDDIEGAVRFARRAGAPVWLAGHSTGCQKSAYWASKKGKGVKGIILLGPMSDYASERMSQGPAALRRAEKVAREYVLRGQKHLLLPENVWRWPWTADAQRFISLYSGDSAEEIFTYWDAKRTPKTLRSVKLPTLVLLAENDEYADRPAKKIAAWFETHIRAPHRVVVIPRVPHSFRGGERAVATAIKRWITSG